MLWRELFCERCAQSLPVVERSCKATDKGWLRPGGGGECGRLCAALPRGPPRAKKPKNGFLDTPLAPFCSRPEMRLRETYACCRGNRRKLAGEKGDALGQLHFSKRWQSTWESARRLSLPRNSHLLDPRKQSARKSQRGGKDKEAAATSRENMRAVVSVAVVASTYGFAPARSHRYSPPLLRRRPRACSPVRLPPLPCPCRLADSSGQTVSADQAGGYFWAN